MAKRRRSKRRARVVRTRRAAPRRASRRRRSGKRQSRRGLLMEAAGAMAYGALRERVSNAIAPVSSQFLGRFLGPLADEAAMGAITFMVRKNTRSGSIVNKAADAGFKIEMARLGEAVAAGGFNILGGSKTSTPSLSSTFN